MQTPAVNKTALQGHRFEKRIEKRQLSSTKTTIYLSSKSVKLH